ncbi:hypothetical protein FACS1894185_3160 [Betaproteobacteria bacterium]|nr:hypothetical protein FACS1894185_3160 [Betaproteobacteria bacterium]
MTIEIQIWHLVSIACSIIGAFWTLAKVLASQVEKRLDEQSAETKKQIALLNERMSTVEQMRVGGVRHDDLDKVYTRLNSMDSKLNVMTGEFKTHSELMRMFLARIAEKGLP